MASGGLLGTVLLAVAVVCTTTGCSTLGYYAQAAQGHAELLHKARPVAELVADPATPAPLRERLLLSQRMRDFAVQALHLPDNASYRRYADLQREAVVWNVVAAPELGLQLKTWCFPVMGCVGYRGYYRAEPAQALAAELRAQGWETLVYGVPAYSTLGWSNWLGGDPLLNTFVNGAEIDLARLIFHELAHQVVYVADDTMFNESFATAVERIGSRLWLQQQGAGTVEAVLAAQAQREQRQQDFRELTGRYRAQLDALYRSGEPPEQQRLRKAGIMAAMRAEYQALKADRWGGFAGYDGWFERANNASFAVLAAYNALVPAFEALFERQGRDFRRFYAEVRRLGELPAAQRRAALAAAAGLPADAVSSLP
jgi:predicted aminopeptidase